MHCSTSLTILPILPRLPRHLGLILILSLLLQIGRIPTTALLPVLPAFAIAPGRWHTIRPQHRVAHRQSSWHAVWKIIPRLLARALLLAILLHASGWATLTPLSWSVLAIPGLQTGGTLRRLMHPASARHLTPWSWSARFQRLYQLVLVLLLLSTLIRFLGCMDSASTGIVLPLGLSVAARAPHDETEIWIDHAAENQYHITLRGAFHFLWEPRDGFEKWMLILFLRRFQRVGETRSFLRQWQITQAFGVAHPNISRQTTEVEQHGWHILSDRYRHQIHSALPDGALSQAILKTWVPAFWLSAWDVRERLIQVQVIPDRAALPVEAIQNIAHHTGFAQVRELLLERFNWQEGQLIAKETWWLRELVALNERLLAKLERGERLTSQELGALEPLRLKTPEKQGASAATPPLAAPLKSALFNPPPPTETTPAPVRCTYCGSEQVAPKSKKSRRKTVLDEFGEKQIVEVLRYYCKNPDCPYHTFTHLPPGLVPHSPYPIQIRLLAVEVYAVLLSTYRRSARLFSVKASTVYHWVAVLSPAAVCLAAYLGVVRTSGVIGLDDKWILVCSPSAVRPHGRRARAVWRYAYFAVDVYSYDLLALELYPEHNDEAVRLILLELKAKGIRPRVVVSDLDPAYGRILPQVFPNAIHHECIFHAIQNAFNQMTKVYGRYYLEKVPETAPLHEAITHLFQAQTQKTVRKRFTDFLELRSGYVTRTPDIACVFDSLERHFPKLVNAIENPLIPHTNNATELVIRRFDQHYQSMCGFDSMESARIYLRLFELVYRLTPFADDGRSEIRGKSPLELAGYDLKALPIADFFINLKLPALALQGAEVVPME